MAENSKVDRIVYDTLSIGLSAIGCGNFMCIHEGTDDCNEKCGSCDKCTCKNCESAKEGTC